MNNKEICIEFCKQLGNRDLEGMTAYISDDIIIKHAASSAIIVRGKKDFKVHVKGFLDWTTIGKIEILRIIEQHQTICIERIDHWQIEGKWIAIPVTALFDLKDHLITELHEYFDSGFINQFKTRPGASFHA